MERPTGHVLQFWPFEQDSIATHSSRSVIASEAWEIRGGATSATGTLSCVSLNAEHPLLRWCALLTGLAHSAVECGTAGAAQQLVSGAARTASTRQAHDPLSITRAATSSAGSQEAQLAGEERTPGWPSVPSPWTDLPWVDMLTVVGAESRSSLLFLLEYSRPRSPQTQSGQAMHFINQHMTKQPRFTTCHQSIVPVGMHLLYPALRLVSFRSLSRTCESPSRFPPPHARRPGGRCPLPTPGGQSACLSCAG